MSFGDLKLRIGEDARLSFRVAELDGPIPHEPGVYLVSRRRRTDEGRAFHDIFYVGHAEDLGDRIAEHRDNYFFRAHDAHTVAFVVVADAAKRQAIADALIQEYRPPYSHEEIARADRGKSALLRHCAA